MRLLQITASTVWRGHEQKIIYLYEAFEEKKYFEEQYIVCPFNTPVHEVAEEKNMKVIGFDYKESTTSDLLKSWPKSSEKNKLM